MLEIRLELLKNVVDFHVIVESNLTHSGNPKPYIFEENMERFSEWKDKIIYVKIEQTAEGLEFDLTKYNPNSASWYLENEQRNAMSNVKDIVEDDAIVLISDLDEIPYSHIINDMKRGKDGIATSTLMMNLHYYFLNCRSIGYNSIWPGTVLTSGEKFKKETPQSFRDNRNLFQPLYNAGNHFSFIGDVDFIREKLQSTAHTEINKPDITSEENIMSSISNLRDIIHRENLEFILVDKDEYPQEIRSIMESYPHLVKKIHA